ncbi:MAG: hypothetical protein K0U38_00900, partial [Epsilonproteobacteria bacterium]|nr:hypothetical protein [Campylobacterota bacterium]
YHYTEFIEPITFQELTASIKGDSILDIDKEETFDFAKDDIEKELSLFLSQEEISYLLPTILYEFMYKEKFFKYINDYIPSRIIDYYRKNSILSDLKIQKKKIKGKLKKLKFFIKKSKITLVAYQYHYTEFIEPITFQELTASIKGDSILDIDKEETFDFDRDDIEVALGVDRDSEDEEFLEELEIIEELNHVNQDEEDGDGDSYQIGVDDKEENSLVTYHKIMKLCTSAEQMILFLKFGIKTKKVAMAIDRFTKHDIYLIRSYILGGDELTLEINQKIKRLKNWILDGMRDKKGKVLNELIYDEVIVTPKIVEKLYHAEPLSYKEISLMFGQQPKWASKKKERLLSRLEGRTI